MSIRPYRNIERRKSRKIKVGNILVGGDAPISVQTMTNTLTTDINGTIKQIEKSAEAGADIIRVSCPDKESTIALRQIVKLSPIPIIAGNVSFYNESKSGAIPPSPIVSCLGKLVNVEKAITMSFKISKSNIIYKARGVDF